MNNERIRILLIEDDAVDRIAVERLVKTERLPYKLATAGTVAEAKAKLQEAEFDVALIDHHLPDGLGLEVQECAGDTPCIFITGTSNRTAAVQAMKAGAYDFLIKDNQRDYVYLLPEVIRAALKRRRMEQELEAYHHRLEEMVAARTAELEAANVALKNEVAERKQAKTTLADNAERFRAVVETAGEAIITINSLGLITFWNKAAESIFGYAAAEIINRSLTIIIPERFRARHQAGLERAASGGEPRIIGQTVKLVGLKKDDSEFPMELSLTVWQTGEETFFTGIVRDITKRKQAKDALRDSRDRFRNVITSISDHIYVTAANPDGSKTNLYFSPNIEALTGYPLEQFLDNWNFWPSTVIHPDDRAAAAVQAGKLIDGQSSEMEYRLVRANGEVIWVRDSGRVVDEPDGRRVIYGVVSDISGRKQSEAELRRRNRELTLLNRIISIAATIQEPETLLEMACRELALACQTPRATAVMLNRKQTRATVVAKYGLDSQSSTLNEGLLVKGNPLIQRLLVHKAPLVIADAQNDSRLAFLRHIIRRRGAASFLITPLVIEGEVIGSLNLETLEPRNFPPEEIGLVRNVADQVAGALARLRLNEERRLLNAAVEQATECVVITNTKGNINYVNPAFEQITGYSRAEVTGQNPRILKSGQQNDAFYKELWDTITAGRVWRGRFINKKKNGDLYTEEAAITPVRDNNGHITNYVAVKRDITRELRLEEQFHQAQRMESIGRLAGGVAHDFNNILTAIMGHSELLLAHFPDPADPRREEVEQIEKAAQRAARLTRQLLAFSRRQPVQLQSLNLNELVTDMEKMLGRLLGDDIALITRLAPNLALVRTDSGQIEQILLNLAVNARDAMPQGGQLTFKTANVTLNSAYAEQHFEVKPGPYVLLSVTDTGLGMDKEIQSHIFEPFFTTKERSRGTGLGLATVHGIVRQNNGHIQVYSKPGQGATFKIHLPRTTEISGPVPVALPAPASLTGAETILVVEDNPGVRLVTGKFLKMQGYTVLKAAHAEAGLQQYKQHKGRIDLLITDVMMPGISGLELATRLTQIEPDLKTLYISGYADDYLDQHKLSGQNVAFLEKPFSLDALARAVRKALG